MKFVRFLFLFRKLNGLYPGLLMFDDVKKRFSKTGFMPFRKKYATGIIIVIFRTFFPACFAVNGSTGYCLLKKPLVFRTVSRVRLHIFTNHVITPVISSRWKEQQQGREIDKIWKSYHCYKVGERKRLSHKAKMFSVVRIFVACLCVHFVFGRPKHTVEKRWAYIENGDRKSWFIIHWIIVCIYHWSKIFIV